MTAGHQPLLHEEIVVLRAPTQAWSARSGEIGSRPAHGVYHSDVRVLSVVDVTIGGERGEHLATVPHGADSVTFVSLLRHLDDAAPDPRIRAVHERTATVSGVRETVTIESALDEAVQTEIVVRVGGDLVPMDTAKAGLAEGNQALVTMVVDDGSTGDTTDSKAGSTADGGANGVGSATWGSESFSARLEASGASWSQEPGGMLALRWPVTVAARGRVSVDWQVAASDHRPIVAGAIDAASWSRPTIASSDDRLNRWVERALDDLDALRLTTSDDPQRQFFAAGAPWFFTLFGRDSLWSARMMLPLGTRMAGDTLRVLATLQGTASVAETAEQPGKIMHELRRDSLAIPAAGVTLPPLYYGTVDATPLWVCVLYDAWQWGLPEREVEELLPNLEAALAWMRDFGDADGDGLLEYIDELGTGLSNQGWKDSGDSVQWRDGTLATGPIALCEVQAYAFEAAMHGAEILDHFGRDGGDEWRAWARKLQARFTELFWIEHPDGAYPAIAIDADKRAVDTVTSNIGHLLGTGLLTERESALVARRLVSPELSSGFGLRTMSTDSAGYWPLSYHGGSVWTHDTAIVIAGLARDGFAEEAASLTAGLLAAASAFDYRMPELHSGDSSAVFASPVQYPAACRPQAWSAAAAVSVLASALQLQPNAADAVLRVSPGGGAVGASSVFPLTVDGLSFRGERVSLSVNAEGEVVAASGAPIEVG